MNNNYKFLLGLLVVALLAACSQQTENIREHPGDPGYLRPTGHEFDTYLFHGYRALAGHEDTQHDFVDKKKFTDRALRAAANGLVEPEEISQRNLPRVAVEDLTIARSRLERVFFAGAAVKHPELAAHAQVMFDCWMEEQEENFQPLDIQFCRAEYEEAICELWRLLFCNLCDEYGPVCPGVDCGVKPLCEFPGDGVYDGTPYLIYAGPYIVYFNFDKDDITRKAQAVIDGVVAGAKRMNPTRVVLTGHTDRAGAASYNVGLSRRRVEAVVKALEAQGVSSTVVNVYPRRYEELNPVEISPSYYGETRPRVPTPDGERKAENRRVEVHFEW